MHLTFISAGASQSINNFYIVQKLNCITSRQNYHRLPKVKVWLVQKLISTMSNQSNPLHPTFEGFVASTLDALLLFEACLSGQLNHVPRRPHDRERRDLIKSSNVFIYEENVSGIKRWTDGVIWSPSRILGNFLIYRELEKPFPPGTKKRALNRKQCPPGGIRKPESSSHLNLSGFGSSTAMDGLAIRDTESAWIGSLTDSYTFKAGGLVKKTISINFRGIPHHLVSYYNVADAAAGNLNTPSRSFDFRNISPRRELITSQKFRVPPIDDVQYGSDDDGGPSRLLAAMAHTQLFTGASNSDLPELCPFGLFMLPRVPASCDIFPYTYHPQHQNLVVMDSFSLVHASQPLPYSIPPSIGSPAPPLLPKSISLAVPSSTASLSYAPSPQENYSLGPTFRFRSSAGMEKDFRRTMSLHDPTTPK